MQRSRYLRNMRYQSLSSELYKRKPRKLHGANEATEHCGVLFKRYLPDERGWDLAV